MFFHNFKYISLVIIKGKVTLFWTLVFPIALTTFMFMAFGRLFEADELFSCIDVAAVSSENDDILMSVLEQLSEEGENQLLNVTVMSDEEAKKALEKDTVKGIIYTEDVSLMVKESSYVSSILESVLQQYKQNEYMYTDIARNHPEKLADILQSSADEVNYFNEVSTSDGVQNAYYNYFYAVFAMSCLFTSFSSVYSTGELQANSSSLGIRKNLAPFSKIIYIVSEFMALLLIHFVVEMIALGYMHLLGIEFGSKYPAIILTLFMGCVIGLSIGVIIGAVPKMTKSTRISVAVAVGMFLSVLADLCVSGIKDWLAHHMPIVNRLNPAALISDCFYSLNVYDGYERFFENIMILTAESVILIVIGFLMIRRNKYASV